MVLSPRVKKTMANNSLLVYLVAVCVLYFIFSSPSLAQKIENPRKVTYLKAVVTISGEFKVEKLSLLSEFEEASVKVYIPQQTPRQRVKLLSVDPPNFRIVNDSFNNTMVELLYREFYPEGKFPYEIKLLVEVNASSPLDEKFSVWFNSSDDYLRVSTSILRFVDSFRTDNKLKKLSQLAMWINDNVAYDLSYEPVTMPASWVFENRKGTCDEFTNLFLSFARVMNLPYRYVSGIALGEKDFEKHAWAEVYLDGKWIPFDPTWNEAYFLDATHIKLANLPSANFSETARVTGYELSIRWVRSSEYKVEVLDVKEADLFSLEGELLTKEVRDDGAFLLRVKVSPSLIECGIVKLRINSCVSESGEDFFEIQPKEKSFFLCGNFSTHFFGKISIELKKSYVYTCPLVLGVEQGEEIEIPVKVFPKRTYSHVKVFPRFAVAQTGQKFNLTVTTTLERNKLYMIFQDEVFLVQPGVVQVSSPKAPGNYTLLFVTEFGEWNASSLKVVKRKKIRLFEVILPKRAVPNLSFKVKIGVKNLVNESVFAEVVASFDEKTFKKTFYLKPLSTKEFVLNVTPTSLGTKSFYVLVKCEDDMEVFSKEVRVIPLHELLNKTQGEKEKVHAEKPEQPSLLDKLIESLKGFFERLLSQLRRLFSL